MARDLPIPFKIEQPTFIEKTTKTFKGAPGVKVNYKQFSKKPDTYPFVTSTIIECEKGEPNNPTIINAPSDFLEIFGEVRTPSNMQCISFLQYSPSLLVSRCVGKNSYNASSPNFPLMRVDNYNEFENMSEESFLLEEPIRFIAQTPGTEGNKLRVSLFTIEEINDNSHIYGAYYAKDIITGLNEECYCVVIFKEDKKIKIEEIFVVPFNDLESINIMSKLVYVRINAYNEYLDGLYDGNEGFYGGNLLFADGNIGRFFYGYDGNLHMYDGNIGLYDGNEFNALTLIIKYYGTEILKLGNGSTERATMLDLEESAEVLDNVLNYDIDLHIGNNVTLFRKDCVNIVGTPKGIEQAKDFKEVFDARRSTYIREITKNTFFLYGMKLLDKKEINMAGDYAGLRSKTVLVEGLGISSSKLSKPFNCKLKTKLSKHELDNLYHENINSIHDYKGIIYCNGEQIHDT